VFVDPFIGTRKAAERRDFTVNALMEEVLSGRIVDEFHGRRDLEQGIRRHVNDKTFAEVIGKAFKPEDRSIDAKTTGNIYIGHRENAEVDIYLKDVAEEVLRMVDTDELIEELANNPRLVKYMDIPIQHISDKMLKAMNRHGGKELIRDAVRRLRDGVPGIVLRSTAMVGFPGETEEDFCELCEFIKEARFDRFGAFTYSAEEGTLAAEFDGQIDEQIKQDRYDVLMQTQLTVAEELGAAKVGSVQTVLCDGYDTVAEVYYGRSYADAPDVDGKVYFTSPRRKINTGAFVQVKITEAMDYDLVGEVIL
jgi:hypothetical protein